MMRLGLTFLCVCVALFATPVRGDACTTSLIVNSGACLLGISLQDLNLTMPCLSAIQGGCTSLTLSVVRLHFGAELTAPVVLSLTFIDSGTGYLWFEPDIGTTSVTFNVPTMTTTITFGPGIHDTLQHLDFPLSTTISKFVFAGTTAQPANMTALRSLSCPLLTQTCIYYEYMYFSALDPSVPVFPAMTSISMTIRNTQWANVSFPSLVSATDFTLWIDGLAHFDVPLFTTTQTLQILVVSGTVSLMSFPSLRNVTNPAPGIETAFTSNVPLTFDLPLLEFGTATNTFKFCIPNHVGGGIFNLPKLRTLGDVSVYLAQPSLDLPSLQSIGNVQFTFDTSFNGTWYVPQLAAGTSTLCMGGRVNENAGANVVIPLAFTSLTLGGGFNNVTIPHTTVTDLTLNGQFTNLIAPNLATITGDFTLDFIFGGFLPQVVILPALQTVAGLAVADIPSLVFFSAPLLTTVTNELKICRNDELQRLCFPMLTSVGNYNFGVNPLLSGPGAVTMFLNAGAPSLASLCPNDYDCNQTLVLDATEMCTIPPLPYAGPPPPCPPPSPPPDTSSSTTTSSSTGPVTAETPSAEPCPEGGVCPGKGVIYPKPGYWNSGTNSGFVAECQEPAEIRCQGGVNSTCGEGYTGVLCGGCQSGYFLRGSECVACEGYGSGGQAALYSITGVLFFLMALAHAFLPDGRLNYVVSVFRWLQLLRVAGTKTGYHLPTGVKQINDNLALITFDYSFLKAECYSTESPVDFARVFWGNAVVLVCFILPPLLLLSGLALVDSKRRQQWVDRMFRTLVVCALLVYYVVATRTVQSVSCVQVGPVKVLRADTSQPCSSGGVEAIGSLGLATFIAFVPILTAAGVWWLYKRSRLHDPRLLARFGYTYRKLQHDGYRFMFEVCQLVQLLLIAIAWNAFPYGVAPYAFAIAVYAADFLLAVSWRPYTSPISNAFAVLSVGVGLISTVANYTTLSSRSSSAAAIPVVVVLFVVVILLSGLVFAYERSRTRHAVKDKELDKELSGTESGAKTSASKSSSSQASESGGSETESSGTKSA